MLAQDLSRLLKGTYFANGETTIVNLQSTTSQTKQLESMLNFVKNSNAVKKNLKVINFEPHVDLFLVEDDRDSEDDKYNDALSQVCLMHGCELLILEGIELLLSLESNALRILRCIRKMFKERSDLSKKRKFCIILTP